jgi:5-formyltetrahydrofolate cyclo-ligase
MNPPSPLRPRLRALRRAISAGEQQRHAERVARFVGAQRPFLRARRIAAYWPCDGELDPSPLQQRARALNKRVLLPVLRPHPGKKLWFVHYRAGEPLENNAFGIPEPRLRNRRIHLPWELDLLLVPLVGFDARCNRLGMGGGFYDRTLAYLGHRRYWRRPRLIGLAHECQRLDRLESNPWDVPLDMVITEERVYVREA